MDIKKETTHNLECIFYFINKSRYQIIHFIGTSFFLNEELLFVSLGMIK